MNEQRTESLQCYQVKVTRHDAQRALATARTHHLTLNVERGGQEGGFNAAETLLAALGACLLTNVNSLAAKRRLQIAGAAVEIEGQRQDVPPMLVSIHYRLILDSPEPEDKLRDLHDLAVEWGTVTNTLTRGITPSGELAIARQ
jgi:uncharacterized OsmC-like protein